MKSYIDAWIEEGCSRELYIAALRYIATLIGDICHVVKEHKMSNQETGPQWPETQSREEN